MTDAPESSPLPLPDICCARCKFYMVSADANPPHCQRFPPVPFIVQINWNETKTQIISNQQISTQPIVGPLVKCGEFVRAEAQVN